MDAIFFFRVLVSIIRRISIFTYIVCPEKQNLSVMF